MLNILKYVVKEPDSDDHKTGYKFPFNACELLSGENSYIIDKFFEDSNTENDEDKYEELDEYEGEKIAKESENDGVKQKETNEQVKGNVDNSSSVTMSNETDGEVDAIVEKLQTVNLGDTVGSVDNLVVNENESLDVNKEKDIQSIVESNLNAEDVNMDCDKKEETKLNNANDNADLNDLNGNLNVAPEKKEKVW
jgi:hypothetical protein